MEEKRLIKHVWTKIKHDEQQLPQNLSDMLQFIDSQCTEFNGEIPVRGHVSVVYPEGEECPLLVDIDDFHATICWIYKSHLERWAGISSHHQLELGLRRAMAKGYNELLPYFLDKQFKIYIQWSASDKTSPLSEVFRRGNYDAFKAFIAYSEFNLGYCPGGEEIIEFSENPRFLKWFLKTATIKCVSPEGILNAFVSVMKRGDMQQGVILISDLRLPKLKELTWNWQNTEWEHCAWDVGIVLVVAKGITLDNLDEFEKRFPPRIKDFFDWFKEAPTLTILKYRDEVGLCYHKAETMLALIILVTEGYYKKRALSVVNGINFKRFMNIATVLPLELQMGISNCYANMPPEYTGTLNDLNYVVRLILNESSEE
jgi:hypothetical protein